MKTRVSIRNRADKFENVSDMVHLCFLLKIGQEKFRTLLSSKTYHEFYLPKPSGGKRLIEEPQRALKKTQSILNEYLQSWYHLNRSDASYGFQLILSDEKNPRNIKTNAERHLSKRWMINADFKDFFHQITDHRLYNYFSKTFSQFEPQVLDSLIDLVTYKGRLPMGAPTSPVLSNMVANAMDMDFEEYAARENLVYSRFADDLTFSSLNELDQSHLNEIFGLASLHGFEFNTEKLNLYGPKDQKVVTGIVVTDSLAIEEDYLHSLEMEINRYKSAREIAAYNGVFTSDYFKKTEQELEGHLQFVRYVYGNGHQRYESLKSLYLKTREMDTSEYISWLDVGYYNRFIK